VAADELPAKPNLVVYRRLALAVGGVSRIDGCSLDHGAAQSPSSKFGGSVRPPSRLSASPNICRAACRARCLTRTDSGSCLPSWRRVPGRGASQRSGSGVVAAMWVPVVIHQRVSRCWNPIRADHHLAAPSATHCVNCTNLGSLQDRIASAVFRSSSANFEAKRHIQRDHSTWPSAYVGAAPRLPIFSPNCRALSGGPSPYDARTIYAAGVSGAQVSVDHMRCGSPATAKRQLRRQRPVCVPGVPPLAMSVYDPICHPPGWYRDGLNGR
jgi:hypothetical protein